MFPWERYKCRSPTLKPSLTLSDRLRNVLSRDSLDDFWEVLQAGVDINTRDWCDRTPLHLVIEWKKDLEIVKAVLSAGADPNAIDDHGNTPLHIAIDSYTSPATINALLNAGAKIDIPDSLGRSPLMKSIHKKCKESVIWTLLLAGANTNVETLMVEAVKTKIDPLLIEWFIIAGAPVNGSSSAIPPILYAVMYDDLKVVKLLLAAGARTDFVHPESGCTLLHQVKGVGVTQELIKREMDVNAVDNLGETPLHTAVTRDLLHVATTLINNGADVNRLVEQREDNCFHCARSSPMVKMLASHGVNINARNWEGSTPLHVLMRYCIFMSLSDSGNYMPVNTYFEKRNKAKSAVMQMIKCGADVNATDGNGRTILGLAVQVRSLKIISHMIKRGLKVCWEELIPLPAIDISSMKLLIQEWAIGNLKGEDMFDYPYVLSNLRHHDLLMYAIRCNAEIELMKVKKINCHNTIYHYVVEIAPKIKALRLCPHYVVSDEDCMSMFPTYNNKVSVRLNMCYKRAGMLDVLENIDLSAPSAEGKRVVSLVSDCKFAIAEYLSNDDLINFFLAMGIKVSENAVNPKSMNCVQISPPFDNKKVNLF